MRLDVPEFGEATYESEATMTEQAQQLTPEVRWSADFCEMVRALIREELAQQPQYPQTGIQIIPGGMRISIALGPGTTFLHDIEEEILNQTRREIKRRLELVQHSKQPAMVEKESN